MMENENDSTALAVQAGILWVYCILLRRVLMLVMKLINTVGLVVECLAHNYSQGLLHYNT